ncbi:MAG: S8 family serine peptidase, partial [Candidatus Baltobacteraceae bacterium]
PKNDGGAFLVAPGGNASGSADGDNLHWIENIYSSTGISASTYCKPDYLAPPGSTADCRVQIEGTSQATPHVAGAAALILAVKPSYTPAQVAAALCSSAADIGSAAQGCGRLDVNAAVAYALAH